MVSGGVAVDGAEGRSVGDWRCNASEEVEVAVNATIRLPEPREERSQHAEEVVLFPEPTVETRFTRATGSFTLALN